MSDDHVTVQTVRGPVAADDLGLVLPHEHLLINEMREQRNIGLVNDVAMLTAELVGFKAAGGGTLVDVTTASLVDGAEPDPAGAMTPGSRRAVRPAGNTRSASSLAVLQQMSEASDVHIVVGAGQYREPYLDAEWVNRSTVGAIADQFISEVEEGIDGSGVRAGIIGEIASDGWYVSALEERCFRAAGRAQHQLGALQRRAEARDERRPIGAPGAQLGGNAVELGGRRRGDDGRAESARATGVRHLDQLRDHRGEVTARVKGQADRPTVGAPLFASEGYQRSWTKHRLLHVEQPQRKLRPRVARQQHEAGVLRFQDRDHRQAEKGVGAEAVGAGGIDAQLLRARNDISEARGDANKRSVQVSR